LLHAFRMTPSHHSWPPYFSPEPPQTKDGRATRTAMIVWAIAVLLAALIVLTYLLWRIA